MPPARLGAILVPEQGRAGLMPWMSYDEAAERLGILAASVKRQARARKWPRRMGNDGRAQVDVPADRLSEPPPSPTLPASAPADASRIAALEERLRAEERRAADLTDDRDRWRSMAEALRADLAAERARSAPTGANVPAPARAGLLARLLGR